MSEIRSYRDLIVWQLGIVLAKSIYELTKSFHRDEIYGLTAQLRRAAVSIPSNIAEGHARDSSKEFLHHISFALGSLAEVETQLILSRELGFFEYTELDALLQRTDDLGRKLRGLQKSIKSKVE
jgi:four helix bundle protein